MVLSWLGMKQILNNTFGETYPLASSVPYDDGGNIQSAYGIAWYVPTAFTFASIVPFWWKTYAQQLEGAIEAQYQVLLDPLMHSNIDWNNAVIKIHGQRFLCKKASVVLPLPAVATLDLVRV